MKQLIILTFCLFWTLVAKSQVASGTVSVGVTLPQISLLDIEPNNSSIILTLSSPTEAGLINKTAEANAAKWLNYTSALPTGRSRSVFVQTVFGTVPSGTELSVSASAAVGAAGSFGLPVGYVALSSLPQILISKIGASYTSSGANRGHALNYKLEVTDVSKLDFNTSGTIGILFTIQDN